MNPVPTWALTRMRSEAQLLMSEVWSISRPAYVPDGSGGQTTTYSTVASGTPETGTGGRLMPAGYQAREQILNEKPGAIGAWTITLPRGTDVQPSDRVIINGRSLEVTGTGGPHTWDTALPVSAAEVRS